MFIVCSFNMVQNPLFLGINIYAMYPEFLYFISYVAMGYACLPCRQA